MRRDGEAFEDAFAEFRQAEFGLGVTHCMPTHLTAAHPRPGRGTADRPIAEKLFGGQVSLPIHPVMTEDSIQYVIHRIRELA